MNDVSSLGRDEWGSPPLGTPLYMAPERNRKEPYGSVSKQLKLHKARKADVYSYGVVLRDIREKKRESFFSWLPIIV